MFVSNPANEICLLWKCPAGLELVLAVLIGQVLKFFPSFFFCTAVSLLHALDIKAPVLNNNNSGGCALFCVTNIRCWVTIKKARVLNTEGPLGNRLPLHHFRCNLEYCKCV